MNAGTKSLLFGVHQFLWHPWTVARAWRHIYGRGPTFDEAICILVHDWGYWGLSNMDGADGRFHPEGGARLARWIVYYRHRVQRCRPIVARQFELEAYYLALHHSSHYARFHDAKPSALYLPDKASILFESRWWYLLRATLSGEVHEYIANSPLAKLPPELRSPGAWWNWYHRKVKEKLCGQCNTH